MSDHEPRLGEMPGRVTVRDYVDRDPHGVASGTPSVFALGVGFLLPPTMGLFGVMFGFAFGHVACETGSKLPVHIFMLVCLALALLGGFLSWREWNSLGQETPGEGRGPLGTRRFMALSGLIGAGISAYIILAQWFPTFVLAPCMRT